MPTKGDFYRITYSLSGKAVGKIVQLIEESKTEQDWWLAKSMEPLDTAGGTKETLVWVPLPWMESLENGNA